MVKKDKFVIGGVIVTLILIVIFGMYYVHFNTKEKEKEEKTNPFLTEKNIRVIISTSDFSKIFHEDVKIAFDKKEWCASEYFSDNPRLASYTIEPAGEGGIEIHSITRGYGCPIYEGKIEVCNTSQGYVIVNELSMESYLRYVVPSEMPASFGQESLKAQAICARNFAYRHIQMPAYIEFGADLDDSIRFQVYNNSKTNEETDKAILATKGQLLMYNDSIVDAYYYSTSWGFTTDLSLWGSETRPYYVSHWQGKGEQNLDLTKENVFKETLEEGYSDILRTNIQNQKEKPYDTVKRTGIDVSSAFEFSEPWFRWETTIPKERILENLNELELIEMDSLVDVAITKRRTGGSVQEVIFLGRDKKVTLSKESEIRKAFHPKKEDVYKNDGTVVHGYEKLPSSFFTIEKNYDGGELVSVTVKGGGCGHGIGMSQNCAKSLANQGKNYIEILQYFYPGTEVKMFIK